MQKGSNSLILNEKIGIQAGILPWNHSTWGKKALLDLVLAYCFHYCLPCWTPGVQNFTSWHGVCRTFLNKTTWNFHRSSIHTTWNCLCDWAAAVNAANFVFSRPCLILSAAAVAFKELAISANQRAAWLINNNSSSTNQSQARQNSNILCAYNFGP